MCSARTPCPLGPLPTGTRNLPAQRPLRAPTTSWAPGCGVKCPWSPPRRMPTWSHGCSWPAARTLAGCSASGLCSASSGRALPTSPSARRPPVGQAGARAPETRACRTGRPHPPHRPRNQDQGSRRLAPMGGPWGSPSSEPCPSLPQSAGPYGGGRGPSPPRDLSRLPSFQMFMASACPQGDPQGDGNAVG